LLLRVVPPLGSASVLSLLWCFHLSFSVGIGAEVPTFRSTAVRQTQATLMPDATPPVNRFRRGCSRSNDSLRFWHRPYAFDTSSVVPLRSSFCQSPDLVLSRPFPSTLTTMAFDHGRWRWFGTCSCKPVPRGLPSSVEQLHPLSPFGPWRSWRTVIGVSYQFGVCPLPRSILAMKHLVEPVQIDIRQQR